MKVEVHIKCTMTFSIETLKLAAELLKENISSIEITAACTIRAKDCTTAHKQLPALNVQEAKDPSG